MLTSPLTYFYLKIIGILILLKAALKLAILNYLQNNINLDKFNTLDSCKILSNVYYGP